MNSTTRQTVLSLYHQLLRESHKFTLYNYREYFLRRIRDEFRQNQNIRDATKIEPLIQRARENLQILRRQVIIGNLYTPEQPSIIENQRFSLSNSSR